MRWDAPRYLWLLTKKALLRAPGQADLLVGLAGAVGAVVGKFDTMSGLVLQALAGDIVIWIACGVVGLRLLAAPYLVWRDDQELIARLSADPTAHQLELNAHVDDNFLEGGNVLTGFVTLGNAGPVPIQVGRMDIRISVNGGVAMIRGGKAVAVRRNRLNYSFDLETNPLVTTPGRVVFEIVAPFGPMDRAATRTLSKVIEVAYRVHERVLIFSASTLSEQEFAITA